MGYRLCAAMKSPLVDKNDKVVRISTFSFIECFDADHWLTASIQPDTQSSMAFVILCVCLSVFMSTL